MFRRNELGKPGVFDGPEMCYCTTCEYDLRNSKPQGVRILDNESFSMLAELLSSVQNGDELSLDEEHLAVLRQFCKLINSKVTGHELCGFLTKDISLSKNLIFPNYSTFEVCDIRHRHITIQLAIWILFDCEKMN